MQRIDEASIELLEDDIASSMERVQEARSAAALGEPCEEIWTDRRGLGIVRLLLHGDHLGFFTELARSAQCRRYHLTRCAAEKHVDFHCTSSRAEPFFDAVAASCLDLGREIARLSPASFREGEEYEDDFLYLRFLHRWVEGGASGEELAALLEAMERVLDGAPSPRLDLCRALLARDPAAFGRAFEALLEGRFAEIALERRGIADDSVCAAAGTHVFVEGLALLRLAALAGVATRAEYPLCPALARLPMTAALPVDPFPPVSA
jgi:hypothetical protein